MVVPRCNEIAAGGVGDKRMGWKRDSLLTNSLFKIPLGRFGILFFQNSSSDSMRANFPSLIQLSV